VGPYGIQTCYHIEWYTTFTTSVYLNSVCFAFVHPCSPLFNGHPFRSRERWMNRRTTWRKLNTFLNYHWLQHVLEFSQGQYHGYVLGEYVLAQKCEKGWKRVKKGRHKTLALFLLYSDSRATGPIIYGVQSFYVSVIYLLCTSFCVYRLMLAVTAVFDFLPFSALFPGILGSQGYRATIDGIIRLMWVLYTFYARRFAYTGWC